MMITMTDQLDTRRECAKAIFPSVLSHVPKNDEQDYILRPVDKITVKDYSLIR